MIIHISFELWGVCNDLNKAIFNVSIYGLVTFVMGREYFKTKDFIYFVFGGMWAYFAITELWIGLNF